MNTRILALETLLSLEFAIINHYFVHGKEENIVWKYFLKFNFIYKFINYLKKKIKLKNKKTKIKFRITNF